MTYPGDLAAHHGLFILDFVADPAAMLQRGRDAGITQNHTLELAAWCAELNEQLKLLADERGIQLQLMGGNAASLRLDVAAQRGSRDNDYLTTATESEVAALVQALAVRFSDLPDQLFRPERISDEGKMRLPLIAYRVPVPSLTIGNEEILRAKIEFHLEDELPPGEQVTARHFALGRDTTNEIPALPYQVGLKLIVFDDPPVGVPPARESAIPRQMHDVDLLAAKMTDPLHWKKLGPFVRRRYEKEQRFQGLELNPAAPWNGIERRMNNWAACDTDIAKWTTISNFQNGEIAQASRRSQGEWRARARRLQVLARSARDSQTDLYLQALAVAQRISPTLSGRNSRTPRAQLGSVMGDHWDAHRSKLNGYPLHATFWEALAVGHDLQATLAALTPVVRSLP